MSVHFFAVLGTGLYEPVVYRFPEGDVSFREQEFIQLAILDRFQEQLKDDGKITIFLTEGARERNWEDRAYTSRDCAFSERWISEKKQEIQEGSTKKGMKTVLRENFPQLYDRVREVRISDAGTEKEIWSVFDQMFRSIDEGDEIIFDVTHGFRSLPMLVMTAINYAKRMKNCTLRGIYYGAYEVAKEEHGVKHAPVFDLTVFNELLEWINAAELFMEYGIDEKMKDVFRDKRKKLSEEEKEAWELVEREILTLISRNKDDSQDGLKSEHRRLSENNADHAGIPVKEIEEKGRPDGQTAEGEPENTIC